MSSDKSKVAVIGPGNIGKVVAANLVKGNREVIVASHKFDDATELAQQTRLQVQHIKNPKPLSGFMQRLITVLTPRLKS